MSMLHKLGANDLTRSRCGASPSTLGGGNRITGRLLTEENSSEALVPFRASSGSHCPLHGS
jgi:hypothetical protein